MVGPQKQLLVGFKMNIKELEDGRIEAIICELKTSDVMVFIHFFDHIPGGLS